METITIPKDAALEMLRELSQAIEREKKIIRALSEYIWED
jgi:hypothetical protein